MTLRRRWLAGIAAALLVAACAEGEDADRSPIVRRDVEDTTTTTVDQAEGIDLEGIPADDHDDAIIEATLEEVEAFWEDAYPEVYGGDFRPVTGGFHPYGPTTDVPRCGGPLSYEEIAQNAFYCPAEDLIAWDTDNLTNDLLEEFGPFSLAIVIAHEYGHAVQARVPVVGPTIATEQQADCFAGAFSAHVADGGTDTLAIDVADLDSAVAGFLSLRDAIGTRATDPAAHGSAFDRIGAFQDGFQRGAARCAEYEEIYDNGGTTVIDLPLFVDETGQLVLDAPFDPTVENNIFDLTIDSLEAYWSVALPEVFDTEWQPLGADQVVAFDADDPASLPPCEGAADLDVEGLAGESFTCFGDPDDPADDYVAFDADLVADVYDEIGDFAVSSIIAQQYAFVAQVRLGNLDSDLDDHLQADCFSGAWAGQVATDSFLDPEDPQRVQDAALSAGDLDEAVTSFLLLGQDADPEIQGTVFERVTAYREGFVDGLQACT